ncbi:MAG: sugar phosphate isomerase/epimerase family protein [Steroidobacteraceae bacterium]
MNKQATALSIDFISVFGLPPVQFVALAAELGCPHISIALTPMPANPHRYPAWSLRDDNRLRRDTISALQYRGVTISLGEGFLVRPNADVRDAAADLDHMCELGVATVNILTLEPDPRRGLDQLAAFADMAGARSLLATLEFLPGLPIGDLSTAAAAVRDLGKPNFRLLLDAMHVFRSGAQVAEIAALDPALIGYAQLCDVPLVPKSLSYSDEARHERLPPGEGELPLLEFLSALPRDLIVGLEIPMLARAERGIGPYDRLVGCVRGARGLLARANEQQ